MKLPVIGLGTWNLRGDECIHTVRLALEMGYKHIDTAYSYENHIEIAKGKKGFDRSKLYITSKVDVEEQVDPKNAEKSVQNACEQALIELETDYLDLYLIHYPNREFPLTEVYQTIEKLVSQGKVRNAGVSNYNIRHLEDLRGASGLVPYANQVEFHPYLYQQELLNYCQEQSINLISYRPFGKGKLLVEEPMFSRIGERYHKTGAQVILRWLLQKGIPTIPKASSEEHLRENLEIFDFVLSNEEIEEIDNLNKNKRYCLADDPEFAY